ncbi:MAG: 4-(cytidine 5'-diphospho)-2-C-methyl-D-erythritol kinase [Bacteroidota bacterium]|nr:4-(cytidine 5'-diphospho)-2-C-methyl-D-erythritol kinase [Bacteroidota bacterium]
MLSFPNAKINIGLYITGTQDNGYHNIETVFYPVPLYDILEVVPTEKQTEIHLSGIKIPGSPSDNLVLKAWKLLHDKHQIPPVKIYMHKHIPAGSGLGGGSSDAAFFLQNLNKQFKLGLPAEKLMTLALKLGSDCPFFVQNKPVFATNRGEIMEEIKLNLEGKYVMIVFPDIHIDTGGIFSKITISPADYELRDLHTIPVSSWKNYINNRFETVVFNMHPQLKKIKTQLYDAGADYAQLTGTGSAIYGIFSHKPDINQNHLSYNYIVKQL